ncbi:MAG: DUF4133 domain-containing protein [Bacteroides sp.]|nr:DUF4133 domain-containing protein [Bacteroides sp.]MCM1531460.1 DUF4133 domain-containing protein [Ruminococcus flavefaciens]MCM1554378.1 DUF4133 domain-containing protein [Bacteroides sp.]
MIAYYTINKGTGKTVEFKGLKAQYIKYLVIVGVALFVLYFILQFTGVPVVFTVAVVGAGGVFGIGYIYKMSKKYGRFGLEKMQASRSLPRFILHRRSFRTLLSKKS